MSPLVTSTMSGISMTPAFMNCSASPEPGCAQNTTRSVQSPISTSDWPTPTVSTITQSKQARIRTAAGKVRSATPPSRRRAAMERTNTPASAGSVSMRVRSPSSAPPERRDDGSTAITPTLRALGAQPGDHRIGQGGFADPGRTGQTEHQPTGRGIGGVEQCDQRGIIGGGFQRGKATRQGALAPGAQGGERAGQRFHSTRSVSAPLRARMVACAAARRAIGTRNGEQET